MSRNRLAKGLSKYIRKKSYKYVKDVSECDTSKLSSFVKEFPGNPGKLGRLLGRREVGFGEPIAFCAPNLLITTQGIYWAGDLASDPRGTYYLTWDEAVTLQDNIENNVIPYGMNWFKQGQIISIVFWAVVIVCAIASKFGGQGLTVCVLLLVPIVLYVMGRNVIRGMVRLGRRDMWWQAPSTKAAAEVVDVIKAGIEGIEELRSRNGLGATVMKM